MVNSWSIALEGVYVSRPACHRPDPYFSALTSFSEYPQDDVFTEASAVAETVSLETAKVEDELIAEELVATVEQVAFEAVSIKNRAALSHRLGTTVDILVRALWRSRSMSMLWAQAVCLRATLEPPSSVDWLLRLRLLPSGPGTLDLR